MDDKNYDEFGHYIGPEIDEINSDSESSNSEKKEDNNNNNISETFNFEEEIDTSKNPQIPPENSYQVTLHEDKNFYPSSAQIYNGVENLVMEEDTQPITEPIIPTSTTKQFDLYEKNLPETSFSFEYLCHLSTVPALVRNVAVAGSLHYGKTTFLDQFIQITHGDFTLNLNNNPKYLDNRVDEQQRGISLKCKPISLVLPNSKGKSYLINFIDTPGHPNFFDEVSSAFRLCDGVIIVVDVIQGVDTQTEKIIKNAITENLDIILVINKIDRLVLELKLPPHDAYYKVKHIIDEFNNVIIKYEMFNTKKKIHFVHPSKGNIIFSSGLYGMVFSLESYTKKYCEIYQNSDDYYFNCDYIKLSKMFFGDIYYNKLTKKFTKKSEDGSDRTFIEFILNPIYKLIGYSLSEEKERLQEILSKMRIVLKDKEYKMDPKPLLKLVCSKFYGHFYSLVDAVVSKVVNIQEGAKMKIEKLYTGDRNTEIFKKIIECKKDGPLAICVYKLYHKHDHISFDGFGRVLSGTISEGQNVRILGSNYNIIDKEDQVNQNINFIYFNQTRYKIKVNQISVGNLVLIDGVDISMSKNFTIVSKDDVNKDICIFKPLEFNYAYMKVSVEPLNPSDLPKMNEGLRKIYKSYPACRTKVEESGENVIMGTGELYMDSILYDLRHIYTEIELKVSDPVVAFAETVTETSSIKTTGISHNSKNTISMIAEPLNHEIVSDIEKGVLQCKIELNEPLSSYLINTQKWSRYTTNCVWAFSPGNTNMLIDYTLPTENDKVALESIRESVVQGYEWACREGPLCSEPILNTKFKIISSDISNEPLFKASGQIIPMARRVCYSSFLTAAPRLMEPMLKVEILCQIDCIEAINTILMRRRGHVESETPLGGTPFYIIKGIIPALDSFGFETDIRTTTAGQAFPLSFFENFSVMPGDPLDRTIKLIPLEPSTPPMLAREAMVKTRRRKGLIEDVNITNYLRNEEIEKIKNDSEYKNYFI